jgi:hypothetical protein
MFPKVKIPKVEIPGLYPAKKKRRPFRTSTKKIEWMRAAGRDPFGTFVRTSKCRACSRKLIWGDKTYEFDHNNNKEWDNSQKNCYLVCLFCHRKATVMAKRRVSGSFGMTSYKTVKKKAGYKKERKNRKKRTRRKKKRPHVELFPRYKIPVPKKSDFPRF